MSISSGSCTTVVGSTVASRSPNAGAIGICQAAVAQRQIPRVNPNMRVRVPARHFAIRHSPAEPLGNGIRCHFELCFQPPPQRLGAGEGDQSG